MKKILIIAIAFVLSNYADAQVFAKKKANKDTHNWRYEVVCVDNSRNSNDVIKVYSFSKKPKVAIEQAKKNAVHAIIFKGVKAGKCITQDPLIKNPNIEQEKKEFFKAFFSNGGKFAKYVTASNNGRINPKDVSKISRKEYKIGVIVSVDRLAIKRDLENAGIIQNIGEIFK